jgi:predicted RND superfamily exporter protein
MRAHLANLYHHVTQEHPLLVLLAVALFLVAAGFFARGFELDASSDSLVLENDADLRFYRGVRARYGSDDFLVVTYRPRGDMMSDAVLADIRALRDELLELDRVESVTTLLDVPLIDSPRTSLTEIQKEIRTLETPDTDRSLALRELTTSPLYRDMVMSVDGRTTAMQINFKRDETYQSLLAQREALRLAQSERELTAEEAKALREVTQAFNEHRTRSRDQEQADIAAVRAILDGHRSQARIHLGGVPMIASDMIDYVRSDIQVFGLGVAVFLVLLLAVFFKRARWVLVPLAICAAAAMGTIGYLGLVGWRVTVVSSNFISLMLIITLSLTVHLVVRYLELQTSDPSLRQRDLLRQTIDSKFLPSLYTALTTMVAFASLVVSDIRPVIDFGWMMVVGIGLAFGLCFLIFPAAIIRLEPSAPVFRHHDVTAAITRSLAGLIERHRLPTLFVYALLVVAGIIGVTRLSVENRFIDYFKEHTEIHQGMLTIDRELGGTTPLDVVIDPDRSFRDYLAEEAETESEDEYEDDLLFEEEDSAGISGDSYWFNMFLLPEADRIHGYLDSLPETGKVLSISTTMALLAQLNGDEPLDNFTLAVMHKRLPDAIRETLFDPYMSEDGNQLRFSIRVIDSDPGLKRDALLGQIREDLNGKLGLEEEQVHLSGMLVLYNNVLQSLFRSQVLTLSAVFVAISVMFLILFRSWRIALIAVVPTLVAACIILGLMGWVGIPLDIMTITIAAITIGIGVDDTIHYTYRIREEFARDGDYWAALRRSHASVGRAIYYTSVTITLGFSILALSNFIPTIYFGLLTGLAMIIALIANLTLLPLLIAMLKPLGPPARV